MPKLRLDVDALEVQSFDTAREEGGRGTVRARSAMGSDACLSYEEDCTAAYHCTEGTRSGAPLGCDTNHYEICPALPPRRFTDYPCD